MNDDIVARLRDCDGGYGFRGIVREAADKIERLRKERDQARRLVCIIVERGSLDTKEEIAEEAGWKDLFKETTDGK